MWPEIPASFENMTAADIRALVASIQTALRANSAATPIMSAEQDKEWHGYKSLATRLASLADDADAAERAEADRIAAEAAAVAEAEAAAAAAAAAAEVVEETEVVEEVIVPDLVTAGTVSTSLSVGTREVSVAPALNSRWVSTGEAGPKADTSFGDLNELGQAFLDIGKQVQAGSDRKHYIAKQVANFGDRPADQYMLSENPYFNLNRFDYKNEDELTAAMCAPLTPLYDLSCDNATRRPVAMGLPNFRSPERGGFSVYPSPSLSDITTGYGQWTSAMDQDVNAIKSACQTITCSTPTEFEIYGIYRCLTVKNLVNMTFPEIVRAYLNRLEARWARFAEVLLLEAMGTGSTTINATRQGYGANISLKRTILNYLGLYQEIERWDVPTMDAWMPRWLLFALRMDALSRRRTDGSYASVPSEETVNGWFREVGVEPHWYMDRPSWATPMPALATSGTMNIFPSTVEILIHKRGKFALMDRGDLQIGVTGNNIYRLSDDLRRNQFTFFFESFEGLIDTDSCPAHIIQIPGLCYNGVQIDDVAIDCEGQDYAGVGS